MNVRGTNGEIIYVHRTCPTRWVVVPSLGQLADRLLDAMGYSQNTVLELHSAYIDAREFDDDDRGTYFVSAMGNYGMAHLEASFFYEMIELTLGDEFKYRDRMDLSPP